MAAPNLDGTPDHPPTPTLTAASTLVNPRTVYLDKPLPDSPESSFEWPQGMIPMSIAVAEKFVTQEAAAAAKAINPHGKQFVKAPAEYKPS